MAINLDQFFDIFSSSSSSASNDSSQLTKELYGTQSSSIECGMRVYLNNDRRIRLITQSRLLVHPDLEHEVAPPDVLGLHERDRQNSKVSAVRLKGSAAASTVLRLHRNARFSHASLKAHKTYQYDRK